MALKDVLVKVRNESDELGIKINNLEEFLNSDMVYKIDSQQVCLLNSQLHAMNCYYSILNHRISLIEDKLTTNKK